MRTNIDLRQLSLKLTNQGVFHIGEINFQFIASGRFSPRRFCTFYSHWCVKEHIKRQNTYVVVTERDQVTRKSGEMRTGKPKEWDEEEKALPPLLPEVSMKIVKAWVHTQGTKKKNIATWRWRNEENNQTDHCQLYRVLRKL